MSGGLLDADPTNFKANSQFIAAGQANSTHALSRDEAAVKLQEYEDKFLALWDEETSAYRKHSEHSPPKQMPTQYLALQQLKQRWENATPLLVAVPAPAGYGKSQLILAWLAYLRSRDDQPQWAVLALTGVAASNTGGSTVHAFFQMRKEGNSGLFIDAQAANEFRKVPWFLDPSKIFHKGF